MEQNKNISNNKRIAKNTLFLYIRLIFVMMLSLYTVRVVLNTLGVVDYGLYNVVAGFVSMFGFLNTSMVNTIQRFYNYEKGIGNILGLQSVYNAAVRIQFSIALITLVVLEIIGVWYINYQMVVPHDRLYAANWVFQFSTLSLFFVILQIPYSAAVVSHEKMNFYAIVGMFDAIFKLLLVLILPYLKYDTLILYSMTLFLLTVIIFLIYVTYAIKHFEEISLSKGTDHSRLKQMASFSGWNIFDSLAYMLQGQGLNMLLNSFLGPIINASRAIAYQIQGYIFNFSSNISLAFKPQLVESYAQNEYERTKSLFFIMSKSCFFMQFVLSVPIILELEYILSIWLGNEIPSYTCIFVRFILFNAIIDSFNMPMSQVAQATGMIRKYQFIRSLVVISVLPLSYFALRLKCSPEVVFISMILVTFIMQPLSLVLLHRVFKFKYNEYLSDVFYPSISFALIVLIPSYLLSIFMPMGFYRLLLVLVLVLITSLIAAWRLFLNSSDRIKLRGYLSERWKKFCR